ncbi:cobalt-precorrin-5B (C(1))-methyltransferase CbiD [Methylocystis sp. IM4]|uniref:cobalt-precorrin-5B (C(1))-methyltransferase CbiD n=1 Tax=Methylocystis sp. IM4 TaxID=3136560 RepID=UPI00311A0996
MTDAPKDRSLRRGWTTGACATAATRAAFEALVTGAPPPDPVEIALPSGRRVAFALAEFARGPDFARAGVVKDAGDDPDVTHGALVRATVRRAAPGTGVSFLAGEGVGTVTRPGLPLGPGEPAINPVPRRMMAEAIAEAAQKLGVEADAKIEISIPHGAEMAKHTLNGRLGIVGGLSILGTTGVVTPFSCAAWIDSIHRGVDVARASGLVHLAATTGSTSEAAVQKLYGLPRRRADRNGGFRRRLSEISAHASCRAGHDRRRLRQDGEARAGQARSAFGPLHARSCGTGGDRARGGRRWRDAGAHPPRQ